MLKHDAGEEDGDKGTSQSSCSTLRPLPYELVKIAHYCRMWYSLKKNKSEKKYQKQRCIINYVCGKRVRTYCKFTKGLFLRTEYSANYKLAKRMGT